jgi:hypothetical protein
MHQPYVLAFVGENANGILRWWTHKVLDSLARFGLQSYVIDFQKDNWTQELAATLQIRTPTFCFSFQGIGMNLLLDNGRNIWSDNKIPFISYLGDSPYHMPRLHIAQGPGMYLIYGCNDFLETYTNVLGGRAFATTFQYGYPTNSFRDRTLWGQRERKVLYVKTGVDSRALRSEWDLLPTTFRTILDDCASSVLTGRDATLAHLCDEVFKDRAIHIGDQRELFLFACSVVDRYVRAVRAERMIDALKGHEQVTIIGDWSHLDLAGSRATFLPPVSATELDGLYADTKIVINSSPPVRAGVHERIVAGLLAKAAVISDATPFSRNILARCPSFFGVNIEGESFCESVDAALANCLTDSTMQEKVNASAQEAENIFSVERFAGDIWALAEIETVRRTVNGWSFSPST